MFHDIYSVYVGALYYIAFAKSIQHKVYDIGVIVHYNCLFITIFVDETKICMIKQKKIHP